MINKLVSRLPSKEVQEALLYRFRGNEYFVERQPLWEPATTKQFIRLAQKVNNLGLDWWFTKSTNSPLRFGRKEKGAAKGRPVGWLFLGKDGIEISWSDFAGLEEIEREEFTLKLVKEFEFVVQGEGYWPAKLAAASKRDGYWPDDYSDEDELEDEAAVDFDHGFPEGKAIAKSHLFRERNRSLIEKAKALASKRPEGLKCACCGFDFQAKYGEIGKGYIEVHHTKPVSSLDAAGDVTRLEDLALVCSNCHRMLHRKRPWLEMPELKKLVALKSKIR